MTLAPAEAEKNIKSAAERMVKLPGRNIFLALLSGIFLTLSFPRPSAGFLAWASLIPLLAALSKARGPREAAWYGWITGIFFFTFSLSWLRYVTVFGWIAVAVFESAAFLLTATAVYYAQKIPNGWMRVFAVSGVWTLFEILRSEVPVFGLGWNLIAYSQTDYLPILQSANLFGAFGLGWVIVLVNAALFECLRFVATGFKSRKASSMLPAGKWAAGILLGGVFFMAYGHAQLQKTGQPSGALKVSLIQGNIPQAVKWQPMARDKIIEIHLKLSTLAAFESPDLILWPEASFPGYFNRDVDAALIRDWVREHRIPVVVGGPYYVSHEQVFNSAYLLDAGGSILTRYDKQYLVPFGEYVPFGPVLAWLEPVAQALGVSDFSSGHEDTVFELKKPAVRFSVLICFEDIFPAMARRFAENDIDFLAVMTNDAWFGPTGAPYQHLQASVFRAVENGLPVIRAANTGISAFISHRGEILGRVQKKEGKDIFVAGRHTGALSLYSVSTLYSQGGWLFPYAVAVLSVMIIFMNVRKSRASSKSDTSGRLHRSVLIAVLITFLSLSLSGCVWFRAGAWHKGFNDDKPNAHELEFSTM